MPAPPCHAAAVPPNGGWLNGWAYHGHRYFVGTVGSWTGKGRKPRRATRTEAAGAVEKMEGREGFAKPMVRRLN